MRATLLARTLRELFPIQRNVMIEGSPGMGKTTIANEMGAALHIPVVQRHLPTAVVEDFGMPSLDIKDKIFEFLPPDWWPTIAKGVDSGLLILDDVSQAGTDLQKVVANIIQERELHGHRLPDGWMIIMTGNLQTDRAGAGKQLTHLRDRYTTLEMEPHLDDWTSWAIDHDVNPLVISFIRFRPNLLHDFDANRTENATPRGWVEGVSDVIGIVSPEAEYECFKGAVGEGPAAEFTGFARIWRKLPNIDNLMLNPSTTDVPDDPATLYAISGAIADRATEANFDRMVTYCSRMPGEFSVLAVSYAARKNPELASTGAFTKWALDHQDVLF